MSRRLEIFSRTGWAGLVLCGFGIADNNPTMALIGIALATADLLIGAWLLLLATYAKKPPGGPDGGRV